MIRPATKEDLGSILKLGEDFGHLMKFHQSEKCLLPHIDNIIVHQSDGGLINGYYHIQPLEVYEDIEFIEKEKCIPLFLLEGLWDRTLYAKRLGTVGVLMQGASHREVFRRFIQYYQETYEVLWSWCSIKSHRPESYKELGFSYNPKIEYTFWNHQVDRESTYQLGRWERS